VKFIWVKGRHLLWIGINWGPLFFPCIHIASGEYTFREIWEVYGIFWLAPAILTKNGV